MSARQKIWDLGVPVNANIRDIMQVQPRPGLTFENNLLLPGLPEPLAQGVGGLGGSQSQAILLQKCRAAKDIYKFCNGTGLIQNRTLDGYYRQCSYGQVALGNVVVVDNLYIPCYGSLDLPFTFPSGNSFDTKSCNNDNMLKWHYYLDSLMPADTPPSDFNHKVMMLPKGLTSKFPAKPLLIKPNLLPLPLLPLRLRLDLFPTGGVMLTKLPGLAPGCNGIAGSASIGPWIRQFSDANTWGTGLIWWSADAFGDVELLFHEAGHNMGMAHANVPGGCDLGDQCDFACPMGGAGGQGVRCLNAPHNWQVGWGRPFLELTDSSLRYGAPMTVAVPQQMSNRDSSIAVALTGMAANQRFYISARINTPPYDLPFFKWQNGRPFVLIHSYAGTAAASYARTVVLGKTEVGETFRDSASGLVVTFNRWDGAVYATVTLCRRMGFTEASCGDGLDDDCDGLPDSLDPDCAGRMAATSSETTTRDQYNTVPMQGASGGTVTPRSPSAPRQPRPPPRPPRRPRLAWDDWGDIGAIGLGRALRTVVNVQGIESAINVLETVRVALKLPLRGKELARTHGTQQ
ncbi:hypothetical protein VOLCADRAFT_95959 [Volvox carteri f. nagariensis]|uniref:Peptidase M11 gametolysin domain-containing protein n=1 Tax=Volvox carteri f. nagariensis TaxID=3068 RepID=D8U8U5_VOLCA|nr:uncharacterized protein VOLCADRAFT_95959 [Volvox carteri f. nagariensis]EFJ43809.1 hypothetical protein VOLCADRAFT_95959 [Volvox carteri f. nagariensis]|eukprot:XP_002955055.1 hypothetical protein VOLCADRAFT_95959 [Volvox carteri f. nagariensis]